MNRYLFSSDQKYHECFHCHKMVEEKEAAFIPWYNDAGSKGIFATHKGDCEKSVRGFLAAG